jgi:antitoxin YefM
MGWTAALSHHLRRSGTPQNLAILLAMTISEQMSLADVKNRLSEVVDQLEREHGRVVITKHGRPAAVVISIADLESLEETLDIMDSEDLLADIREGLTEIAGTGARVLSKDEALRLNPGR